VFNTAHASVMNVRQLLGSSRGPTYSRIPRGLDVSASLSSLACMWNWRRTGTTFANGPTDTTYRDLGCAARLSSAGTLL
jgi:hypothetical protein